MKDASQIKHLQVSITRLQSEISNLQGDNKRINEDIAAKRAQLSSLQEKLSHLQLGSNEILLSEHAIIRYLQRVYRLDLQRLSSEILTDELKVMVSNLGNGTYAQGEYRVKVIDNTIVTILEADEPYHKSSRAKKNKSVAAKQQSRAIEEEMGYVD